MFEQLIATVAGWVVAVISGGGYLGVAGLMALDSANIPIPSEIILPFAGYLVSTGRFALVGAIAAGTIGSTLGAMVSYWIGVKGGRPFVLKYGKWVLISRRDVERGDRLFKKYGNAIAFFSRMTPLIRTFISLPAGIARMPFGRFVAYTAAGSLVWCTLLVYAGVLVGQNYQVIKERFKGVDIVVGVLVVLGLIAWVVHFLYERQHEQKKI